MILSYQEFNSSLGRLLLCAQNDVLTGIYFCDQKNVLAVDNQQWQYVPLHPLFLETQNQLVAYMVGKLKKFDLPYATLQGTLFQQRVWKELASIPYGKTVSYKEIATKIGSTQSVQAVANAVAKNPLTLVVPCHRVIGSDGSLTGYAGGLHRKKFLLDMESPFL